MENSGFIVINSVHNNDHGESVLLVSSLSVLIILLVVAAIFVAVHTDGQSKVSFQFQLCLLVSTVLNCLVSQSQTLSSYTRLFVNSTYVLTAVRKFNYPPRQSTNMCKAALVYLNMKKNGLKHSNCCEKSRIAPPGDNHSPITAKPSTHHVYNTLWVLSPCPTLSADTEPAIFSVQCTV